MRAIPLSTLALGAVLSLAGGGPAVATTSILNCPYTILQPGIYQLGRSLTCSGDAITVQANGVQLFLGSRTLTGNGTGAGVFAQGVTGLLIMGSLRGEVTNFNDGIFLVDTEGALVSRVVAQGNTDTGIEVDGCAGCQFLGNSLNGNGYGIYAFDCADCQIVRNQANDSGSDGITILGLSPRFLIEGNTANGNEDGIDLQDQGAGAENGGILSNTTNNNTDNGIDVDTGWTGNRILGNRATGNQNPDLNDDNLPDCVNTWRGNKFATDNEGDGPRAGCIQ